MIVKIGDKIKLKNENVEGEVIEVLSNNKYKVKTSDGFDSILSESEFIIINPDNSIQSSIDKQTIKDKISTKNQCVAHTSLLEKYIRTARNGYGVVIEVDLHLEKIEKNDQKLNENQKLAKQINHAKVCLNATIRENKRKIIFIHGVGTGALKSELIKLFRSYDDIVFRDADNLEYGKGAIEVEIRKIT